MAWYTYSGVPVALLVSQWRPWNLEVEPIPSWRFREEILAYGVASYRLVRCWQEIRPAAIISPPRSGSLSSRRQWRHLLEADGFGYSDPFHIRNKLVEEGMDRRLGRA